MFEINEMTAIEVHLHNDVIMALCLVLLHVQNCFVYKMIAVLKQINKPRFKIL